MCTALSAITQQLPPLLSLLLLLLVLLLSQSYLTGLWPGLEDVALPIADQAACQATLLCRWFACTACSKQKRSNSADDEAFRNGCRPCTFMRACRLSLRCGVLSAAGPQGELPCKHHMCSIQRASGLLPGIGNAQMQPQTYKYWTS
jgi:hypothetical protein